MWWVRIISRWMRDTADKVAEKSSIGTAITYTYPLRERLGRYVNDGKYQIDNNLVENAARPRLTERTICSVAITMQPWGLQSYTCSAALARLSASIHENGWKMCWSVFRNMRQTIVKTWANSFLRTGSIAIRWNPSRINSDKLYTTITKFGPTLIKLGKLGLGRNQLIKTPLTGGLRLFYYVNDLNTHFAASATS